MNPYPVSNSNILYPAARLNNTLSKLKVKPKYELIDSINSLGITGFIMRVTSPIKPNGPPLSADGPWAQSKKKAKHLAAASFMQIFLENGNNEVLNTATRAQAKPTVIATVNSEAHDLLKTICSTYNLKQPEYRLVCDAGSTSSPNFTVECKVSDLCTEGQGRSKADAKLHAILRMLRVFFETICSIDDPSGSQQLPVEKDILDEHKPATISAEAHAVSHHSLDELPKVRRNAQIEKILPVSMNNRKTTGKIEKNNNDSALNKNWVDLDDDTQPETFGKVQTSNSNYFHRNSTRLQVLSNIGRTLGNIEEQLHDKILSALAYSDLQHQRTVVILSQVYRVLIDQGSPTKIFKDDYECNDHSIRLACLTKLLLDLREHIETNHKFNK